MLASGNKSYGIEVVLQEEGNMLYRICELEKSKNEIKVNWLKEVKITDDIKTLIKKDFPVSVVVSGKGILYKSVDDIKNPTIQQFFPGINLTEFYSSITPYRNISIGYIIRKRTIDELIDKLLGVGLNVVGVSFGSRNAIAAFSAIEDSIPTSNIIINNVEFTIGTKESAHKDTDISTELSIGDEMLPITYVNAYTAALSYYLGYVDDSVSNIKVIENGKQFRTNTLITRYSLIFLSIVLSLIMLSTVANYYYSGQLNELSQTVPAYSNNDIRDSLIAQINIKKKFLVDGDWLTSSQSSFYADRVAASIPQGIKLTGLNIYPKTNLIAEEDNEALNFNNQYITIKGVTRDELVLKNWIEAIKGNKWVNNISVSGYQWNSKTNEGEFDVKVGLRE